MSKEEIIEIALHGKDVSEEKWIEVIKESKKMPKSEYEEFKKTLAGRIVAQVEGLFYDKINQ